MSDPLDQLPHRGLARFLVSVDHADGESGSCTARISSAHPSVQNGVAPACVLIEFGAQAAAALATVLVDAADGRTPAPGRVVAIREARLLVHDVPADTDLAVRVKALAHAPPLRNYWFEVGELGTGIVGVWAE